DGLFFWFHTGLEEVAAVNDTPVGCQSRDPTERRRAARPETRNPLEKARFRAFSFYMRSAFSDGLFFWFHTGLEEVAAVNGTFLRNVRTPSWRIAPTYPDRAASSRDPQVVPLARNVMRASRVKTRKEKSE
ncbi:MAG: hypothetical protein MJ070_11075, partial [Lachnospiraceae bacterium]|nr:hypothetical protein [Lachnospiraceae bacterium]